MTAWDGRPSNPERDGWHWLRGKRFGTVEIGHWRNGQWGPPTCSTARLAETDDYLGPALQPAEVAAKVAAAAAVCDARADEVGRLHSRYAASGFPVGGPLISASEAAVASEYLTDARHAIRALMPEGGNGDE